MVGLSGKGEDWTLSPGKLRCTQGGVLMQILIQWGNAGLETNENKSEGEKEKIERGGQEEPGLCHV